MSFLLFLILRRNTRTAVFTLGPRGADLSAGLRLTAALRFHGGVQREGGVVGERSEPIGGQSVSQRVRQLQSAEAVGHAIPPGLLREETHRPVSVWIGNPDIIKELHVVQVETPMTSDIQKKLANFNVNESAGVNNTS